MKINRLSIIATIALLCVSCGDNPVSRVGQDEPQKGKPLAYITQKEDIGNRTIAHVGYIDVNGNVAFMLPDSLELVNNGAITKFCCGRLPVMSKETRLFGYLDTKGDLVIPCQYRDVSVFYNDFASAWTEAGNVVIDKKGNVVHYQDAGEGVISIYCDRFILARRKADNTGSETRIVDANGKELKGYDGNFYMSLTNDPRYIDMLKVEVDGHVGVVNIKGKQIVPSDNCLQVLACPDGESIIAVLGNHENPIVYNTDGKMVKELENIDVGQNKGWHDDMLLDGWGKKFLNSKFEVVAIDDSLLTSGVIVKSFHEGLARLENPWSTYYINKQGHLAFGKVSGYGFDFSDGVAFVRVEDPYYINEKGDSLFSEKSLFGDEGGNVQYTLGEKCVANRIRVGKEVYYSGTRSKVGFIDKKGKVVIPFQFDLAYDFHYTESNNY